jgi:hypothetical protein
MMNSKLLILPPFTSLPKSDAADVKENIDLWLDLDRRDRINSFLRPWDKGYRGYRFVTSEDLKQVKYTNQVIIGVHISVEFTRIAHTPNYSFCPLWFNERRIDAMISISDSDDMPFPFKSDNDLKNRLRSFKKSIVKGD